MAKSTLALPDDPAQLKCLLQTNLDDETKLQVHYQLARKYRNENPDLAHYHLDQVEVIAQKVDNKPLLGKALSLRGKIYRQKRDYVNILNATLKAKSIFKQTQDTLRSADELNNIGVIFMDIGNYYKALDYLIQAAEIYEGQNDIKFYIRTKTNISICYIENKQWELARKHINSAIDKQLSFDKKDSQMLVWLYTVAGNLEYYEGAFDKAVDNYKKAFSLEGISDDAKAGLYFNMANAFQNDQNFAEAEKWLMEGKELQEAILMREESILKHYNIEGEFYQLQGQHDKAIKVLNEAIHYATKVCANKDVTNSLQLLSKSQMAILPDSLRISVEAYQRVEEECRQQLNLLLEKEIDDFVKEEKRERKAQKQEAFVDQLGTSVGVLILVLIGISITLNRKRLVYKRDHYKLNKIRRVLNDD
ncbi:tetratricopeptide repeat protein [Fulvivirga sediminis]|uniref:Tetratricopeptide repeat protein n=1 Tax=Fulvivirga sediminis TaxID=2803949 RepID=A0A937F597_9BACT|nr:tetratricopeptide repeat protein [Fulvivirga sediminis]MBL3655177.1 tetratricopeptide repeat protein [Fulvivirga sediminis]